MKLFDKLVVCELSVVRYPAMVVDLAALGIIEVVVNGDSKFETVMFLSQLSLQKSVRQQTGHCSSVCRRRPTIVAILSIDSQAFSSTQLV